LVGIAALLSVAGCSEDEAPGSGWGSLESIEAEASEPGDPGAAEGCGEGRPGASGGPIDPGDPCASLMERDQPSSRVVWVTEPEPLIVLEEPIELLWGLQYAVRVPLGERAAYALDYQLCTTPANLMKTCEEMTLPLPADACAVVFAPKFGVDETQYNPGLNVYSFTLRLRKGCELVSEASTSAVIDYEGAP
jgi:hypothetical protein